MPSTRQPTNNENEKDARGLPGILCKEIFDRLGQFYGRQNWWPADTVFEVMVGAILTQNTAWTNVEKAIKLLQKADVLNAKTMLNLADNELATLIRPSGYYNIKTQRLKNYCQWYVEAGEFDQIKTWSLKKLRQELLSINGIGPETADDIGLYAFERPVFVIDTYTRRIFSRQGLITGDEDYEQLRALFEQALAPVTTHFKEYHALIVLHAKTHCMKKPNCMQCPLMECCNYGKEKE